MKTSLGILIFLGILISSCNSTPEQFKPSYQGFEKQVLEIVKKGDLSAARAFIDTLQKEYQYDSIFISKMDSLKIEVNSLIEAKEIRKEEAKKNYEAALSKLKGLRAKEDEFNKTTFYRHRTSPGYVNRNGFYLKFSRTSGNYLSPLRLHVQYYDDDWLFIEGCKLLVDDETFDYYPGAFERDNDSKIWEYNSSNVNEETRNMLSKIAESKVAKIRFIGQQYYNDKTITSTQKKAIKEVMDIYYGLKREY